MKKKPDYPFSSRYQMQTVSLLGWNFVPISPPSFWNSVWLKLSRSPTWCCWHVEFMCASVLLCLFFWIHPLFWVLRKLLSHLLYRSLNIEGRGMIKAAHLRQNTSKSLTLFTFFNCESLFSLPSIAKSFSDKGWWMYWSIGTGVCHYWSFYWYVQLAE